MKCLRSITALVIFGLSVTAVRAGELVYRQLGIADGLFNNQARMVSSLPDGRVLVVTDGMFNLYNGARFEPMDCDQSHCFPIRSFTDMCQYEVQGSKLWFRDFYYLYLLDTRRAAFIYDVRQRFAASGLNGLFQRIFFDQDDMAWVVTFDNCLYRYDWHHKAELVWRHEKQNGKDERVIGVCQNGPFHCIFFANGQMRLWEQKRRAWVFADNSQITSRDYASIIALAWDAHTIVVAFGGANHRLMAYDIFTHQWKLLIENIGVFTSLHRFGNKLYATNDDGLLVFDQNLKLVSERTQFLLDNGTFLKDHLMDVLVDRQGGLWLCTFASGVLYTHQLRKVAVTYSFDSGSADQRHVRCLIPYDSIHLLAGTADGLFLFDVRSHEFRPFSPRTQGMLCFNLSKDSHCNIWASTSKGLFCLHGQGVTLYSTANVKGFTTDLVRECQEVAPDIYIICNSLNQIGILRTQSLNFVPFNSRMPQLNAYRTISNIRVFPERHEALVNTQNGSFFYDYRRGLLRPFPQMEGCSNKFNCQYSDSRQQLWMGTQNGLLLCSADGHIQKRFTTRDGLPSSCIQAVTENRWGQYWISTSNGVALLRQTNASEKQGEASISTFGVQDGVQSAELAERAVAIMPDGQVYFGGLGGITCMDTKLLASLHQRLRPMFIDAEVLGIRVENDGMYKNHRVFYVDSVTNQKTLRLRYNENFVTIHFSALNYICPQHTIYRYRLRGVDKQWNFCHTPDGMGTASYTSLGPGTYVFETQARQQGEKWGEALCLSIIVHPPFWATWWAYTLYICFVLALIYFFIRFYLDGQRAKLHVEQEHEKRVEQQRLDELKFRFFTNISHEFRTPLTLIITPLEMLMSKMKDRSEYKDLERIRHSALDLLLLVNQLLDFRRLEKQGEKLNAQPLVVKPFVAECFRSFQRLAEEKNIRYELHCTMSDDDIFSLDADKMKKVLNNLLSNAFKFTPDGGQVTLSVDRGAQELQIIVSDSGIGIPDSDLPHVFDRFYQSESSQSRNAQLNTGSGIGLHLVKGYVDLHHGRVAVESRVGKGSIFRIFIPEGLEFEENSVKLNGTVAKAHLASDVPEPLKPHVLAVSEAPSAESSEVSASSGTKKITLLVVEDNYDFREFLTEVLSSHYNVVTAADGVEGLHLAYDASPDLILSDVMMPRMDGYELCRTLKNDLRYSHIPIILLTAKNSDEGQAGAYEAGADSYISKPFGMEVLLARIKQLLEQMERRRKLFHRTVKIDPKEIAVTSIDEQLMQRALDCMEKHMADADYSVELLSKDIGIDRTHLYRKMQTIIGQTPSDFMRSVRLKRAAQLLRDSDYSVSQVSVMVGFNTTRYFSQYFKEMFGVSPVQYNRNSRAAHTAENS